MRNEFLTRTINSRVFYVKTYRKAGWALIASVLLNLIIILTIAWWHLNEPEREFYASNGASPPMRLVPLDQPNMKSTPILGTASEEA